jgi:hypothetical protein
VKELVFQATQGEKERNGQKERGFASYGDKIMIILTRFPINGELHC